MSTTTDTDLASRTDDELDAGLMVGSANTPQPKPPTIRLPSANATPQSPPSSANNPSDLRAGYTNARKPMLETILLIAAAVCFALAAANVAVRVNLVALGLLAWVLTILIPALD